MFVPIHPESNCHSRSVGTPDLLPLSEPLMPSGTGYAESLAAVLADARLTIEEVAEAAGIARSTVSRMLSGQFAIAPEVLKAVWGMTHDDRIARIVLGPDIHVARLPAAAVHRDGPIDPLERSMVHRFARCQSDGLAALEPAEALRRVDALIESAALLRRRLAASGPSQAHARDQAAPRAARRLDVTA